ncbi:flagellar hook-associated protein 2 [Blastococcus colisei]|uniref:Flagellar hook-associated protein 2 n=1 Tax=Blastococcus colisei TaxID=1564162 RepID=A0A543P054_9ACTN|nr:flagellar filament capping protein FliD [Blastococcus colisei]TQN37482.1 flagellar hook-associated protein 2 [Blastococcus colisei]
MTMSINTGLVSGIDAGSLVSQLLQVEAAPQTALKSRLATSQVTASAYRTVNSALQALTTKAGSLLEPDGFSSAKGSSTSTGVTVTTTSSATPGSLTFTVAKVATTAASVSADRWATTSDPAGITTLDIRSADGSTSKGTVALDGTESLTQVAAKINADSALGLTASAVQVAPGQFALQISASTSGQAAGFSVVGNKTFDPTSIGQDAELTVGADTATTTAYTIRSASNTFEGVLAGATFTVTKEETTPVTVTVAADPDAVASKVSSLVDAVNNALSTIKTYTNNAQGSTAALRGEYAVTSISSQLLQAVSDAVGSDGSPARIGIELTRDGTIEFDAEKFTAALQTTPDLAQRLVTGSGTSGDPGAVAGIAGRVREVAEIASNATTGTLSSLAKGQDSLARDIKDRIADWDVRLAKRKVTLTRQFTAMETALSSLQNQSNWLAGQLSSLPS